MPLTAKYYLEGTDKLRELVLYICVKCELDEAFASTKLNKILFFSDFLRFSQKAESITKQEYFKIQNGPAPRNMKNLIDDMVQKSELSIVPRQYHNREQKKPLALRSPDLSLFTPDEIVLVDEQIKKYWGVTASKISDASHDFVIGWDQAREKQTIPYSIALVEQRDLTDQEKQWAQELDLTDMGKPVSA